MKLLIVDDDPDVTSLIERTAPPWLEVEAASSSREAMERLEGHDTVRPDLALVDLHLPAHLDELAEIEGLALVRWLYREGHAVPVVLISSHAFPTRGNNDDRAAVLGLLRKPLDLTLLYRFLAAWAELFRGDRYGGLRDPGALRAGSKG